MLGGTIGSGLLINTVITNQSLGSVTTISGGVYIFNFFVISFGAAGVLGNIYATGVTCAGSINHVGGNIYYTSGTVISTIAASTTLNLYISYNTGSGLQISSGNMTLLRIA